MAFEPYRLDLHSASTCLASTCGYASGRIVCAAVQAGSDRFANGSQYHPCESSTHLRSSRTPGIALARFPFFSNNILVYINKFIGSGKGSIIGLGAIPPSADKGALDGVSVRGIVSSRVLSFTMLRTFHFGKGVEGDAAIRALIAAALLRAMAGYDENPVVRANCALTETGKPSVVLNKRYGEKEEFEPLTAESTEKLLEEAYTQAREKAGIVWNGQEFLVQGNPAVFDNASAEE